RSPQPAHIFSFLIHRRRTRSTLFPYTTLFRSELRDVIVWVGGRARQNHRARRHEAGTQRRNRGDRTRPGGRAWHRFDDVLAGVQDRKSTRLNSSHVEISYAVFCLKKKKKITQA